MHFLHAGTLKGAKSSRLSLNGSICLVQPLKKTTLSELHSVYERRDKVVVIS